eukprot:1170012-Amphidinium_carterae.1
MKPSARSLKSEGITPTPYSPDATQRVRVAIRVQEPFSMTRGQIEVCKLCMMCSNLMLILRLCIIRGSSAALTRGIKVALRAVRLVPSRRRNLLARN